MPGVFVFLYVFRFLGVTKTWIKVLRRPILFWPRLWYTNRVKEDRIMFYYYDRDRDGIEHCCEVPDKRLVEDMENRLLLITKAIGLPYPVDIVKEYDVFGYRSADAYLEAHDDEDFAEPISALMKGIKEFGYPFVVYTDADHVIRACRCSEFSYRDLVQGYARYSGYKVLPDWYYPGGIDIDTANRYGMSGLLRFIRRDIRRDIRKAFIQELKDRFKGKENDE